MEYQIPIFNLSLNGEDFFLAHLHPIASEARIDELKEVFDDTNEYLNEMLQDTDPPYERQRLRLFYFDQSRGVYILWYPEEGGIFLNKDFDKTTFIQVSVIRIESIEENFPHIFLTEEQLNN